jgi:hypothetical protein
VASPSVSRATTPGATPASAARGPLRGSKLHNSVRRYNKTESELRKRFQQPASDSRGSTGSGSPDELASSSELNQLADTNPFASPMSRGSLSHAFTMEIEGEESMTHAEREAARPVCEAAHATAATTLDRVLQIIDLNDEDEHSGTAHPPPHSVVKASNKRNSIATPSSIRKKSPARDALNSSTGSGGSIAVDAAAATPAKRTTSRIKPPKSSAKQLKKGLKDVHGRIKNLRKEVESATTMTTESTSSVSATSSPDRIIFDSAATPRPTPTQQPQHVSLDRSPTAAMSTSTPRTRGGGEHGGGVTEPQQAPDVVSVSRQAEELRHRAEAQAAVALRESKAAKSAAEKAESEAASEREKVELLQDELAGLHQQVRFVALLMDGLINAG